MMDFDLSRILLSLPGIFLALSLHESAHAWMALKLGDNYSASCGRVSINPIHHIDPIGFLCLIFFGFGWAKPVMVDSRALKNPKRDDSLIALAGPCINFLSAFLTTFVLIFLRYSGVAAIPLYGEPIFEVVLYFFLISIGLGVFNLIPIPPLDGSHVLLNLIPYKYSEFSELITRYGWFVLIFLVLSSRIFGVDLLPIGGIINSIANVFLGFATMISSWFM